MQQTTLRLKEAVSTSFHTSTKILANSVTKHHFRHKPRLIQVTNTQLSEPSDPHVVNMVEGGDASYSPVTDAEDFIYRNLHMGFNIKASIKERKM